MIQENTILASQPEKKISEAGFIGGLAWFFSGVVFPMASLAYYRKAAQKSVGSAILFFIVFTLVLSAISTISFGLTMFSVLDEIQKAYATGDVPEITIAHGVTEVNGPQPFILFDDTASSGQTTFVAVDTTGEIEEIDTNRFD